MQVIRVEKKSNYVKISNVPLFDHRLSYRARGVLAVLLALSPTWQYNAQGLASMSGKDGRDAVRAAIHELELAGYVSITQMKDEQGHFGRVECTVYEVPCTDSLSTDSPSTDSPSTGKPPLYITNNINNYKIINNYRNKEQDILSETIDILERRNGVTNNE